MPIITDPTKADEKLRTMCPPDVAPTLDAGEWDELLNGNVQASIWVAGTGYVVGDVVIPVTRNGHRFECVTSGTSSSSEPSWPTRDDGVISDGTATWQEAGREIDLYNLREAAHQGWELKASKSVPCTDYGIQNDRFSRSQVYDHCKKQALQFAPIGIA